MHFHPAPPLVGLGLGVTISVCLSVCLSVTHFAKQKQQQPRVAMKPPIGQDIADFIQIFQTLS